MSYSPSQAGPIDATNVPYLFSPPSKSWKTYGFAIAIIIIGIGGLAAAGVGVAGYLGAISNLNQVQAITMMAAGGGGGAILLIVGIVGAVKNCKRGNRSTYFPPDHNDPITTSTHQAEFIKRTRVGKIRDTTRFGKEQWEMYFGHVGEEPPLPGNLDEILSSPCPFSEDESVKVKDTHMLVLVPATVNGEPLSLDKLEQLIQHPHNEGHATNGYPSHDYRFVKTEYGTIPVEQSHWVLMTRDIIPDSSNKTLEEQMAMIDRHEGYRLPRALEAAVCILMEHVFSGSMLFGAERSTPSVPTYTHCEETLSKSSYPHRLVVGGFDDSTGLIVSDASYYYGAYKVGAAALREL